MAWPADPTWFYQQGSGPLLDMGAYGLTRVTGVLGPAQRVTAMSGITVPTRRARGGAFDGLEIGVTEPDNNLLLLDFGEATFATVDATFNVVASQAPQMEIYGLEGTLLVNRPDATVLPGPRHEATNGPRRRARAARPGDHAGGADGGPRRTDCHPGNELLTASVDRSLAWASSRVGAAPTPRLAIPDRPGALRRSAESHPRPRDCAADTDRSA